MATAIKETAKAWRRFANLGVATKVAGVVALLLMALAADVTANTTATTASVRIVNSGPHCTSFFCYKPGRLVINAGTTVTWTNRTSVPHTVTRCTVAACGVSGGTGKDQGFGSGTIPPGGTYSFTFQSKGTYVYYCAIHGYGTMHAKVVEVT
jgi:plastocyanin